MSPLMRERIGKVFILQSYDYAVVVTGFLMTLYSKEGCDCKDLSMSPGSCFGRGPVTLTPLPNGIKVFCITRRIRCIAETRTTESYSNEKTFLLLRGDQTWCLSPKEPVLDP